MSADKNGIAQGIDIVRRGGVVAYPTETFYGLGADPFNPSAVDKVYRMKCRSSKDPILLLIPNPDYLSSVAKRVTPLARRLMECFWPGPLTIVLEASDLLAPAVTGGTGTVGVRVSVGPIATLLVGGLGQALTATSANRTGEPPAESAGEVARVLRDGTDLILDGGPTPGGLPSTIVDARGEKLRLIREGRIASADLYSALA